MLSRYVSILSAEDVGGITFFLDTQKRLRGPLEIHPCTLLNQLDASIFDALGDIAPATSEKLASSISKGKGEAGEAGSTDLSTLLKECVNISRIVQSAPVSSDQNHISDFHEGENSVITDS